MSEPQAAAAPEPERLTWSEICQRYRDEWVVLVDIGWFDEDNFEFDKAVVLGHAKERKEVSQQTRKLLEDVMESGTFFTGPLIAPVPRFYPQ